jgi:hypothetical protein
MIARQAISSVLYGFDRSKSSSMLYLQIEKAYNLAQKNGCKLNGWELRLVLSHEMAMVTGLYKNHA